MFSISFGSKQRQGVFHHTGPARCEETTAVDIRFGRQSSHCGGRRRFWADVEWLRHCRRVIRLRWKNGIIVSLFYLALRAPATGWIQKANQVFGVFCFLNLAITKSSVLLLRGQPLQQTLIFKVRRSSSITSTKLGVGFRRDAVNLHPSMKRCWKHQSSKEKKAKERIFAHFNASWKRLGMQLTSVSAYRGEGGREWMPLGCRGW